MKKIIMNNKPTATLHQKTSIQKFRFYSQLFAVAINLWIGIQFYLFVKQLNGSGFIVKVPRPSGVEGWLPLSSLVSLRYWFETGIVNNIHPAGLIILIAIVLSAFFFKKGFCSWVCPIGFISEMLGDISDKIFKRRLKLPAWLDYPLRSIKYILLGFFIYAIFFQMTSMSIGQFLNSTYNKAADILMLRFFTDISMFALVTILLLFFLSLILRGFWCRYLCPYGALLGIMGLLSPTRIIRNEKSCINCSACARVCPAFIKVDKIKEVHSDECSGCMACVDSCPVSETLQIHVVTKKRRLSKVKWAVLLVIFFWGVLLLFKLWGPWNNSISVQEYRHYLPVVNKGQLNHPAY